MLPWNVYACRVRFFVLPNWRSCGLIGLSEETAYVAAALSSLRKRITDATSRLPSTGATSLISLGIAEKRNGLDPEGYLNPCSVSGIGSASESGSNPPPLDLDVM